MAIVKVIEVLAEGESMEAAIQSAVKEASQSVRNISEAYVKDFQAIVENNQITKYRVNAKISFLVNQDAGAS